MPEQHKTSTMWAISLKLQDKIKLFHKEVIGYHPFPINQIEDVIADIQSHCGVTLLQNVCDELHEQLTPSTYSRSSLTSLPDPFHEVMDISCTCHDIQNTQVCLEHVGCETVPDVNVKSVESSTADDLSGPVDDDEGIQIIQSAFQDRLMSYKLSPSNQHVKVVDLMNEFSEKISSLMNKQINLTEPLYIERMQCDCAKGQHQCHHICATLLYANKNFSKTDTVCQWKAPTSSTEITASELFPKATNRTIDETNNEFFFNELKAPNSSIIVINCMILSPFLQSQKIRLTPVSFPIDLNKKPIYLYLLVLAFQWISLSSAAFTSVGFDNLSTSMMGLCSAYFSILQETIVETTNTFKTVKNKNTALQKYKIFDGHVYARLNECVEHHIAAINTIVTVHCIILTPLLQSQEMRLTPMPFPIDLSKQPLILYLVVYGFQWIGLFSAAWSSVGFDNLSTSMMGLCSAYFSILQETIIEATNTFKNVKDEYTTLKKYKSLDVYVYSRLSKCVEHHIAVINCRPSQISTTFNYRYLMPLLKRISVIYIQMRIPLKNHNMIATSY
ncbi:hypothetical protein RN001_001565 [Aquatica leii]|uniref:Odorant receptor n=1 Tax=Aquatica leii TaxID=1421715 RepID=A0AAN7PG34_9COLE|nr:hypothetical protein RN001_001565 [Aquatica leii]